MLLLQMKKHSGASACVLNWKASFLVGADLYRPSRERTDSIDTVHSFGIIPRYLGRCPACKNPTKRRRPCNRQCTSIFLTFGADLVHSVCLAVGIRTSNKFLNFFPGNGQIRWTGTSLHRRLDCGHRVQCKRRNQFCYRIWRNNTMTRSPHAFVDCFILPVYITIISRHGT